MIKIKNKKTLKRDDKMKLYECVRCAGYYYKKTEQCPFCDSGFLIEIKGTEEEVLLTVLCEINTESGEYEQHNYDSIKELVDKKIGNKEYDYTSLDNALKEACNKGYFTEMTFYMSSA